jgi:integrase
MAIAFPAFEVGAPQRRVSSHSFWTDRRWLLDGKRPGLAQHVLTIDWDVEFADGSRLTDPHRAGLLEAARRFLWSLKVDPPPGRGWARSSSLGSAYQHLRLFLRWMIAEGITCFADLDHDAAERFLSTIAARPGRHGGRVSAATLHSYANLIALLYAQREKLPDAPLEDPFGGRRTGVAVGLADHVPRPLPYTPDAIAVPLVAAALRLLGPPADDVIALRDRIQPLYERLLAQGHDRQIARHHVLKKISAFRFATIAGEEAAWHPAPVIGTKRARFLVERIYDACFIVITYLIGARASEILALESGCVEHHSSAYGTETFSYLRGHIYKTAAGESGNPHRWVAPPPVVRAVNVLERLSEPLRRRTGRSALWLTAPGHGIIETRPPEVPSASTMVARLNQHFAPFIALPPHVDGKPWHLTTHQGRKTFARFVGRRDRTGLHALQAHFGHVTRVMTDRGYVGTDFELTDLVDAQTLDETRAALEELLTATRLAGRAGRLIAARSRFRGRTRDSDVREYVEFVLTESAMRLGVCDWGYCVYRRETSACLGDDAGPNPALRTESTCVSCANFAVTERHRPVWEARRRRNRELLADPRLDAESRALAEARVAECDRVLSDLIDAGDVHGA